ncbi:hypothetical protein [Mucilaginibacter flavidus]|uniref:hypothetical protein n=1 Tax=Mucilaginibacter flavidus TaxID=2949309 RepID=UPI002093D4EC|nr:hypothetical protein [Mucilaginibacter flavidus]MCO5950868.1 hypothetical protein [Mucilaginibacter flavidus]
MKAAITDANIFIDLIALGLIQHLFGFGYEIHTTREVYDQLNTLQKDELKPFVLVKKLIVYNFSFEEIVEIGNLILPVGLEAADKTVYYYAIKQQVFVISGDNKLKDYCESKQLSAEGIIWLFDIFLENELISTTYAVDRMELLLSYNDRLPKDDCHKRIKKWEQEESIK